MHFSEVKISCANTMLRSCTPVVCARPCLIHGIFKYVEQHGKVQDCLHIESNTLHRKTDRYDNPLSTVYRIYGILIIIVIKVKRVLAPSLRQLALLAVVVQRLHKYTGSEFCG